MIDRKVIKKSFEPGWKEQIYYPEVIRGLGITGWHFVRNMWSHILRYVFFIKSVKPGFVTIQYPEERRPLSPKARLRHRLMLRADGSIKCVACMMCETICPCDCIHITAAESENPGVEKYAIEWDLDLLRCCFCGYCVEACPEDAIRMDFADLDLAGWSRGGMVLNRATLLKDGSLSAKFKAMKELQQVISS
jgi:NADH-quinone oxidoreductase subunit I